MVYPDSSMARDAQRRLMIRENIFFWSQMPRDHLDALRYKSLVVFEDVAIWPRLRYIELLEMVKLAAQTDLKEPRNLLITF